MLDARLAFEDYCQYLAERAVAHYYRQITPVLYLYGYSENGVYTELELAREKPRHFELVILTHVPRDKAVIPLQRWFVENLRRAPVMSVVEQWAE